MLLCAHMGSLTDVHHFDAQMIHIEMPSRKLQLQRQRQRYDVVELNLGESDIYVPPSYSSSVESPSTVGPPLSVKFQRPASRCPIQTTSKISLGYQFISHRSRKL